MDAVPLWVFLIAIGLIGALLGLLWNSSSKRLDAHEERLHEHDGQLARLETEMKIIHPEINNVRKRLHDVLNDVTGIVASIFKDRTK